MILDHKFSLKKKASLPPTPGETPMPAASSSTAHYETEKPPPYVQGPSPPPLPPRPPASPQHQPDASNSRRHVSESSAAGSSYSPQATVNQVHLNCKGENIIGTFYIDPLIPSLTPKRKKFRKKATEQPHASFQTHSGNILLSLGTTANVSDPPKANVNVVSRSGRVDIRLLAGLPSRPRIGLDVVSRSGDVTLWLPDNFSGLVQLNTRKGEIHVLPRLLETAKVLKQTDFEALIVVGSGVAPNGQLTDLCQLNSHRGKVIVGFDGMDRHLEKTGFWKKLSDFFKGNP